MSEYQRITTCIGCGCTEMTPCDVEYGACSWIEAYHDIGVGVCSECPDMLGLLLIAHERQRQIHKEGFDIAHDDEHTDESLAEAAAWYASPYVDLCRIKRVGGVEGDAIVSAWPESWEEKWDKKDLHDRIKQLQIAGALIAAEIDRLYRAGER